MVGIVIVSHSSKVAEGLYEMAEQICQSDVAIIPAGGLPDGGFGTDADRIRCAIKEADSGDGVLILGDMGSSIMTAEMVLELLGDGINAVIADAPLVEGTIAAVSEADGNSTLEDVKKAAEEARHISKL